MKKLLFVLLMVLSGQVVAATEIVIPYSNLPAGGPYTYLRFHNTGCIPPVNSIESGNSVVAVWLASIGQDHITLTIYNAFSVAAHGTIKVRLGNC